MEKRISRYVYQQQQQKNHIFKLIQIQLYFEPKK